MFLRELKIYPTPGHSELPENQGRIRKPCRFQNFQPPPNRAQEQNVSTLPQWDQPLPRTIRPRSGSSLDPFESCALALPLRF